MTPKELAERASELLDSEIWALAYDAWRSSLHEQWESCSDWRERERIYDRLQALKDLKAQLESFQNGALRKEPLQGDDAWKQ